MSEELRKEARASVALDGETQAVDEHAHDFHPSFRCEHLSDWTRGIPEDTPLLDESCGKGRTVWRCACGESGYDLNGYRHAAGPNGIEWEVAPSPAPAMREEEGR